MPDGTYVAYTGASANMAQLEVIANNIANASTVGFRRDRTVFDTVMGGLMPFVNHREGGIDLSAGTHRKSGNPLHAALSGDGFFAVLGRDGTEFYTRRGDFRPDSKGQLVLPNGLAVAGSSGGLMVPSGVASSLREDGTLVAGGQEVGRLKIVRFANPTALRKAGENLIEALPGAGVEEVTKPRVAVGFLEQSNVNLAAEMVAMIQNQRSFEASMKSIQLSDELAEQLIKSSAI